MFVRPATSRDFPKLPPLIEAAFARHDEAVLVQELRESGAIEIEFVATDREKIVGHVVMSRLVSPPNCLALAPVSVDPERHHKGIGSTLIKIANEAAEEAGWTAVFVLGDPGYYSRFGYETEDAEGFETPYSSRHTAALVFDETVFRTLEPELIYPPAF